MLYTTSPILRKSIFGSHELQPNRYSAAEPNELDEADPLGAWAQLQTFENNGIHYFLNGADAGSLEPVSLCGSAELKPFSLVFRFPLRRQPDDADVNCADCASAVLALRNG